MILSTAASAMAADGSGRARILPDSVSAGSSGNNLQLIYTADDMLWDGSVKMTVPDGFPDPNPGNTTVTVAGGFLATVLDALDLPITIAGSDTDPGWYGEFNILGIGLNTVVPTEYTGADRFQGDASLRYNVSVALGVAGLLSIDAYKNLEAGDISNWSDYKTLSFWIRKGGVLFVDADIDLADSEFTLAGNPGLQNELVSYDLNSAFVDVDLVLLNDGEWAHVVIDLTKGGTVTPPSNVSSFGLRTGFLVDVGLGALGHLDLDYFTLGAESGTPVFMGNMATANLTNLDADGMVVFDYHGVTAPNINGVVTFEVESKMDAGNESVLTPIDEFPTLGVIAVNPDGTPTDPFAEDDVDGDGENEFAIRIDVNAPCFDFYLDPNGNTELFAKLDGNQDGCFDFFIETNNGNECPDVYWDPTDDFFGPITQVTLSINGVETLVCAYDSTGDGQDDSYILPDPGDPTIGGAGAGGANPFAVAGSGGCGISKGEARSLDLVWGLLFLFLAPLVIRRFSLHNV